MCLKNIKKKLASNVFVPTNAKNHQHSISQADGFLLVGSSPKPFGNTEYFLWLRTDCGAKKHDRGCSFLQPLLYIGQHRTMGTAGFGGSFAPLCGVAIESIFSSCHSQLEVLGVGEDFLLVGILLLFLGTLDDQCQSQHVNG